MSVTALMALPAHELRQHDRVVRRGRGQEVASVYIDPAGVVHVSFYDGALETFRLGETVEIQRGQS